LKPTKPLPTHAVRLNPIDHGYALRSVAASWRGVRYDIRPEIRTWMRANFKHFRYDRVHRRYGEVIIRFDDPRDAVLFKLFMS
jgi:hypothetical protein